MRNSNFYRGVFWAGHSPKSLTRNSISWWEGHSRLAIVEVIKSPTSQKFQFCWDGGIVLLFFNFEEKTLVLFVGPLIPLFRISGDICLRFESQHGSSCFHALLLACNRIIRFTSGETPADISVAMHGSQDSLIHVLMNKHCGAWDQDLPCMPLPHSVRPGRHSTDWAVPAWLGKVVFWS